MNGRAVLALRCAAGLALIGARAAWWAPTVLFLVARLAAARVRFGLVMAIGRALAGLGCTAAACRVYRHEQRRAGQRMVEIRTRRGW